MIRTNQAPTQIFPVQATTLPLATATQTSDLDLTTLLNFMMPMMIMVAMMSMMGKMVASVA
jgi:hypothetical protein